MNPAKWLIAATFVLTPAACSQPVAAPPTAETDLPVCTMAQSLAHVPGRKDIEANRLEPLPVVRLPFGTQKDMWGFDVRLRVDQHGVPTCYVPKDEFDRPMQVDPSTRTLLAALRYRPFLRDGAPVVAIVSESVREEEITGAHIPTPQVPLEQVRIRLDRSGCYGWCPVYSVEVRGDGTVTYNGQRYVNVEGTHTYRIPPGDVARLVESLRARDLWSLRPSYRAPITDNPTYTLTLDLGGQVKEIEDYVGRMVGMPVLVTEFEDEVDRVARSDTWVRLSQEAVTRLEAEDFDFTSAEGGRLLARAVAGKSRDDAAIARLIELGAPLRAEPGSDKSRFEPVPEPILEAALSEQRTALIEPLLAKRVLLTNGQIDQAKLDAAFRAAIAGGRMEGVQRMWEAGGDLHPSLTFEQAAEDGKTRKTIPVTLLLSHPSYEETPWDGLEIAKWLVAKGCDLKARDANGGTLLHIAADAEDATLVRYLLDQGLDPSTPGRYDLPALGSVSSEDIALMLLEAGSTTRKLDNFPSYARERGWPRVVEWLEAHGRRKAR